MADPSFYMRYPNFRNKAVTLSYDDGITPDLKLCDVLDRYGLKCTFNINAGYLGQPITHCEGRRLLSHEIEEIAARGHEIAAHGYKHKFLSALPSPSLLYEMIRDRRELEAIVKRPVTGLAYAMGDYDERVIEILRRAGFRYARTTLSTRGFRTPIEPLALHPTCHHNDARLMELAKRFIEEPAYRGEPRLFYLWGHSYEFDEKHDNNWEVIEEFAAYIGGREDVWYVTNGEFLSYIEAYRALVFDVDMKTVYNPTATDVYLCIDGKNAVAYAGKLAVLSEN